MAFVKNFWKNLRFINGNNPNIHCPTCNSGILVGINDTFKSEDTADTKALKKSDYSYTEMDVDFKFSVLLRCNNKECQEVIACIGTGYYDQEDDFDSSSGQNWPKYFRYYRPEFFSKPIHIIELKKLYPKEIKKSLEDSFKLFFCDSEACANKIRSTVEILMDILKVKKSTITTSRKRKALSLHGRIQLYQTKNKQIGDLLLAIKWIGNSGSHTGKVTRDDTLDAYRILEYVLITLFQNDADELNKIAKQINRMKKPLSSIKRKK